MHRELAWFALFFAQRKTPRSFERGVWNKSGDDLLSHAECTLPSAQLRFTSEFGMGSGGSTALMSPESWEVARLPSGIAPTFMGTECSECLAKNTSTRVSVKAT